MKDIEVKIADIRLLNIHDFIFSRSIWIDGFNDALELEKILGMALQAEVRNLVFSGETCDQTHDIADETLRKIGVCNNSVLTSIARNDEEGSSLAILLEDNRESRTVVSIISLAADPITRKKRLKEMQLSIKLF